MPLVSRLIRVHRIPHHVRDDAYAPRIGAEREEQSTTSEKTKMNYFSRGGWTNRRSWNRKNRTDLPVGRAQRGNFRTAPPAKTGLARPAVIGAKRSDGPCLTESPSNCQRRVMG